MGSLSDWEVMSAACTTLEEFGIEYEKKVISAHRAPGLLVEWASTARERGIGAIIAGAGGAAHLAGVTAGLTPVPVIGVPIRTQMMGGLDSLLVKIQTSANAGKLYGAVTAQDIATALNQEHGIEIDKRKIVLKDSIKTMGKFDVEVKLFSEITGTIHVLICEKS